MSGFYDGNRLLTMKDIDGDIPEIFIVDGNRTAGKTFYFKNLLVKRFLKNGSKFMILVRYAKEINGMIDAFFKDLIEIKYPTLTYSGEWMGDQLFQKIYVNEQHCGYCVAINQADKIKKYSPTFVDVSAMFFDEFQTDSYCKDEINKFISIHISVARGGGQHVRYVPVYMCSNHITILNPYYSLFGISKRWNSKARFLRGNGWVFEFTYNENAAGAIKSSGFGKATATSAYMGHAIENVSLLDNTNFIEKIKGEKKIYTVIVCDGQEYGVWNVDNELLYISNQTEPNWPYKLTFKTSDHNISYLLQKHGDYYSKGMRIMFQQGRVRFQSLEAKNVFLDFIGYSMLQ